VREKELNRSDLIHTRLKLTGKDAERVIMCKWAEIKLKSWNHWGK
jgi:hypothetical protein